MMVTVAAWWGLGYAALLVTVVTYGWRAVRTYVVHPGQQIQREAAALKWTGRLLSIVSTVFLWAGLLSRASRGHGWPVVSPADAAAAIALLLMSAHLVWSLFVRGQHAGLATALISLVLLSYGLGQFPHGPVTLPLSSKASLASDALNLCGGSLLALSAATGLTYIIRHRYAPDQGAGEKASEMLVRAALVCLAFSLAIDTWWLQKIGLGNEGDVQQAGIAIAWMVYFVALRLRTSSRWRGWPWASILIVGFACTLPILLDVPWLGNKLPI
jgi:hypothetical protein